MTTTTSDRRPLPFDLVTLRQHYYPVEPESDVSRTLAAIHRIDKVIATVREQVARCDEQDRQLVADMVEAALVGSKLEPIALRMAPGDGPILRHRLEQLQAARTHADHLKTRAEFDDPTYLGWKQSCARITQEWRECLDYHEHDSDSDRLQRLADFAVAH